MVDWYERRKEERLGKEMDRDIRIQYPIAIDVRRIKCSIENDDSYTCDLTSGGYSSWFARCVGDFMRGKVGRPHEIKRLFTQATRSCRGNRGRRLREDVNLLGEVIGAPKVERYFAKKIIMGKGIKTMTAGKGTLDFRTTSGIMCFLDENKDYLVCGREV